MAQQQSFFETGRAEGAHETAIAFVHGWRPEDLDRKFEVEEVLRETRGLEGLAMHAAALSILRTRGILPIHFATSINALVDVGRARWVDLLIGAGGAAFNNANANLGVGDSSTAYAAGQIDLQAAVNIKLKAMDVTFPSRAGNVATFRSTFGTADGNFVWNEWGLFDGTNHATATLLNRAVPGGGLGTKTSAAAWQFTVTITLT